MKSLLWWCICLLVDGSRHTVDGRTGELHPKSIATLYLPAASQQQKTPPKNYRLPTTDYRLPCQDSSPAGLETLGDLAVENSREIAVLEQAIQLQKKKLWTSWLNADGLNPLAIGLRIARNVAGGGERAAAQLELARLELRQAELATQLRDAVSRAVFAYETARQELTQTQTRLTAHQTRLAWLIISYRLGEGSTEMMLQFWQQGRELQAAFEQARLTCQQRRVQLEGIVLSGLPTMVPATS